MEPTLSPSIHLHSSPPFHVENLYIAVTAVKLWMIFYCVYSIVFNLFSSTWIIISIFAVSTVFGVFYKFRVPPADSKTVENIFGKEIRPILDPIPPTEHSELNLSFSSRVRPKCSPCPNDASVGCVAVIGHRGAGLDAPENSLSAFRQCKAKGCSTVEFDLSLTKDNVLVVFHDENLIRIAGIDRDITDMTWDELKQIDISVLHPLGERFKGERVPTFDEAVTTCLSLGLNFIIDIKDYNETVRNYP